MAGYRTPYTHNEDLDILKHILDNKTQSFLRGNASWKGMEEDFSNKTRGRNRTWQSLKEHFRKHIFPRLHTYVEIPYAEREIIRKGFESTKRNASPETVMQGHWNIRDLPWDEETHDPRAEWKKMYNKDKNDN